MMMEEAEWERITRQINDLERQVDEINKRLSGQLEIISMNYKIMDDRINKLKYPNW